MLFIVSWGNALDLDAQDSDRMQESFNVPRAIARSAAAELVSNIREPSGRRVLASKQEESEAAKRTIAEISSVVAEVANAEHSRKQRLHALCALQALDPQSSWALLSSALTCLFAALTQRFWDRDPPPQPSSQRPSPRVRLSTRFWQWAS